MNSVFSFAIALVVIEMTCLNRLCLADDGVPTQVMLGLNTSGHNGHVTRLIVDQQRSQLISVSHDKTIRFWDLATFFPIRVLRPPIGRGMVGELYSGSLSPDGSILAVGGYTAPEGTNDHRILLISLPEGKLVHRLKGNTLPVQDLAFSPDGRWLASGGTDGVLRLRETTSWTPVAALAEHRSRIDCLAWQPDSSQLVTGSWDQTFRIWRISDGTSIPVVAHAGRKVYCVAWNPDGKSFATGGGDNWIKVWDPTGRLIANLVGAPEFPETVCFSPDGAKLVYGYGGRQVNPLAAAIVRLSDRAILAQYYGHLDIVKCSTFSPDGKYVFIGDSDDQICVWEADTGRLIRRLRSEGAPIYATGFSPDARTIAFGYSHVPGSSLHGTNPLHRSFSLEMLQFGALPDVTYVRAQQRWGNLSITRPNHRTATVTQFGGLVSNYYDPNITIRSRTLLPGNRAALGCDQNVIIFDALTGRSIYRLPGHLDAVWAVTPSPDQKHLLTGSDDETLQIWNLERYEHTLSLFFAGDDWVAWTPQGYYAASPGGENYVGWHVQRGFDQMADYYPASRFRARFYRPELIRRVLAFGGPLQALKEVERLNGGESRLIDIQHSLPPKVTLKAESVADADEGTVQVEVQAIAAEGDSIRSLRLLIDGRPGPEIHDREALAPAPSPESVGAESGSKMSWRLTLSAGNHQLAVKAESDRSTGISDVVSVEVTPLQALLPRLFVLAIGVSANQRPDLRRPYAAADAQAIATILSKQSPNYRDIHVRTLTDLQVTRWKFDDAFRWLQQNMTSDDVALIYYSGYVLRDTHGDLYFQHVESRPVDPAAGVVDRELQTLLQQTRGQLFLMLDVIPRDESPPTAAPSVPPAPTPIDRIPQERRSMDDLIRQLASEEIGVAVLANIGPREAAQNSLAGRSPFAQSILDGLSGKADVDGNGSTTIKELIQFVRTDVKQRTNNDQTASAAVPALQPTIVIGSKP